MSEPATISTVSALPAIWNEGFLLDLIVCPSIVVTGVLEFVRLYDSKEIIAPLHEGTVNVVPELT